MHDIIDDTNGITTKVRTGNDIIAVTETLKFCNCIRRLERFRAYYQAFRPFLNVLRLFTSDTACTSRICWHSKPNVHITAPEVKTHIEGVGTESGLRIPVQADLAGVSGEGVECVTSLLRQVCWLLL